MILLSPLTQFSSDHTLVRALICSSFVQDMKSSLLSALDLPLSLPSLCRMCTLLSGPLASEFALRLLQCLRVSDAPRFYGLPSLERSLRSMTHTTALPGWSTHTSSMEAHALCRKYLSGLLEVHTTHTHTHSLSSWLLIPDYVTCSLICANRNEL